VNNGSKERPELRCKDQRFKGRNLAKLQGAGENLTSREPSAVQVRVRVDVGYLGGKEDAGLEKESCTATAGSPNGSDAKGEPRITSGVSGG